MLQYRLLRNNKESGPYTKEQLIAMGLKTYDLIWKDGKSAAWNYPSEMEEFKAFAPAMEEQPFDRFFKKENKASSINQTNSAQNFSQTSTIKKEKPRIKIKADWQKIEQPVFATETNQVHKNDFEPLQKTVSKKPSWEDAWTNWEQEKKAVAASSSIEKKSTTSSPKNAINDVAVETKFSQSLDDIKERYVETILKPKQQRSFSLKKYILPAILFPLLGFGMWVGFTQQTPGTNNSDVKKQTTQHQTAIIPPTVVENNNASAPDQTKSSEDENQTSDINVIDNTNKIDNTNTTDNTNKITKEVAPENKIADNNNNKIVPLSVAHNKLNVTSNKPAASSSEIAKQNITVNNKQALNADTKSNTDNSAVIPDPPMHSNTTTQNGQVVRNAARRGENNLPDNSHQNNSVDPIANNSVKPVVVAPAKKKIDDFIVVNNGAQNMHLSVQNVADFPLDLTVLDIQYFDGSGHFQKGETVYVKNIPASETVDIKVPDSKNTAKIRYKVSLISAEKKNLYMIAD
ncbi:MAG: hypothetical protein ACR2FN_09200 [Chitinophagaceae bacterium]